MPKNSSENQTTISLCFVSEVDIRASPATTKAAPRDNFKAGGRSDPHCVRPCAAHRSTRSPSSSLNHGNIKYVIGMSERDPCEVASPRASVLQPVADDAGAHLAIGRRGLREAVVDYRVALDADGLAAPGRIKRHVCAACISAGLHPWCRPRSGTPEFDFAKHEGAAGMVAGLSYGVTRADADQA